jgi:hypothetical protein
MATIGQDVAALQKAVKDLQARLDAIESDGFQRLERAIRETLLRQQEESRVLADQRHAEIMSQFEKLTMRRPPMRRLMRKIHTG